jgi:alpha-L-fucosidase
MARSPYTEWYENSLRYPDSPVARHHREVWGDRPYEAFAADYEAGLEHWDPQAWAEHFRAAGARYVVLVAKHHDGYCLWPTRVTNPNRPGWHTTRDVIGELAEAVRGAGLRFGLYYSGGLDWTFEPRPVGSTAEVAASIPQGAYPAYAEAHVRELIERYRPSVLWNDIAWPGRLSTLVRLIDDYRAAVPDGLVNDRWLPWSPAYRALELVPVQRFLDRATAKAATKQGGLIPPASPVGDVRTPEYVSFEGIRREPWECVRGIDRSFGFNRNSQPEHFLRRAELLDMVADIASKGGNLLLNVGPRGEDATIPDEQLQRLAWLGEWTSSVGDALYATRPWIRPSAVTEEGHEVRFTARNEDVYAHVLADNVHRASIPGVTATPTTAVTVAGAPVDWTAEPTRICVDFARPADRPAIRLHAVDAR